MRIRHYFEYGLALFIRLILNLIPRRAALWLGRRLGDLFYYLDSRHRKITLSNLDIAYRDEIDGKEKKRIAKGSHEHFGSILFDFLRSRNLTSEKVDKCIELEGEEYVKEAYSYNKGVLILTAHFGYWELMGMYQGFLGMPLYAVARKLDNPLLEKMLYRYRTLSGNTVLYKQNAVKAILQVLKEKNATAVLIDQNISANQGVFVDFFGVKACTTPIISAIALRTGAPVVPAFSVPLPKGKWRFIYEKPIIFKSSGNRKDDIRAVTQQCTDIIERYIRMRPDVWLWMHRRWKTRPPEEKNNVK